jgi:hypothetical protein
MARKNSGRARAARGCGRLPAVAAPFLTALVFTTLVLSALVLTAYSDNDPSEPPGDPGEGAIVVDHTAIVDFATLSASECESIRAAHRITYGHTSHGSQLVTGMQMLAAEDDRYALPALHEVGDDLGHEGDVSWASLTR